MGSKEKESYRDELRTAVRQLSDRCLYSASKWAAEQLVGLGIEEDPSKFTPANPRFQRGSSSISHPNPKLLTNETPLTPIAGVSFFTTPIHEDDDKNVDADCYMLSKSYFNCKEYRRACHALRDQSGKKVVFLRCYSLYLVSFQPQSCWNSTVLQDILVECSRMQEQPLL